MLTDIAANLISDVIFVSIVGILFWLLIFASKKKTSDKAYRLLGLTNQDIVTLYISGFRHEGVASRRVVNAVEYEAATELRNFIKVFRPQGFFIDIASFLGGLIGRTLPSKDVHIEVAPLEEIGTLPSIQTLIVLGGPRSNQLTKYLMSLNPQFKFNEAEHVYEEKINHKYQPVSDPANTSIIEKLSLDGQIVLLFHGFGESHTRDAVRYLITNWQSLVNDFGDRDFAIRV
jgi:hypothetical protein